MGLFLDGLRSIYREGGAAPRQLSPGNPNLVFPWRKIPEPVVTILAEARMGFGHRHRLQQLDIRQAGVRYVVGCGRIDRSDERLRNQSYQWVARTRIDRKSTRLNSSHRC